MTFFAKIIFNELANYWSLNNLLTDSKYNFRKNHSTQSDTLELIDRLMISMHKTLAICLDFSKAFDTLDHEILLYKLKLYGIKDKDLFLFRHYLTYLTNRRQYTELGGLKLKLLYRKAEF